MKVVVISLPREMVLEQLDKILPGLLKWANEHKNYFKSNIQSLLERLLRKFGFEMIEKFVATRDDNDGGRKLVYSLKKKQKKKKLQQQSRGENAGVEKGEDDSESDRVSHFFFVYHLDYQREELTNLRSLSGPASSSSSPRGRIRGSLIWRREQ